MGINICGRKRGKERGSGSWEKEQIRFRSQVEQLPRQRIGTRDSGEGGPAGPEDPEKREQETNRTMTLQLLPACW